MARRVCLSIGVSTVTPPQNQALVFPYLDGAVIAARTLGLWAINTNFGQDNVRVVDDGEQADGKSYPVTRERVEQAVKELFPEGADQVEQLILMFSGHGLTDSNFSSISWLFSDSLDKKYRVVADRFYSELQLLGVDRITLISDACREPPRNFDLLRLDAVRGIVVTAPPQSVRLKLDRLSACQDGKQGFMVSDPMSATPGKCIFSGVVLDALHGLEPSAVQDGFVTTSSLGACVLTRATERAQDYMLTMEPDCTVFVQPAKVLELAKLPSGSWKLQPWPPAPKKQTKPDQSEVASTEAQPRVDKEEGVESGLWKPFGKRGRSSPGRPSSDWFQRAETLHFETQLEADRAERLKAVRTLDSLSTTAFEQQTTRLAMETAARDLGAQMRVMPWNGDANLFVMDRQAHVWSSTPSILIGEDQGCLAFRLGQTQTGSPALVRVGEGHYTPVVPYDRLFSTVVVNGLGDVFTAYGIAYSRALNRAYELAVDVIQEFAAGRINARGVDRISSHLRMKKHVDPMIGVLCAHLYRATADIDSIRRMAFFYVLNNQSVPFDIALLGEMCVEATGTGLNVHIPHVAARQADQARALPSYVTQETPAVMGLVGGRCPWIGLGWDYVADPRPEWAALVEGLGDVASSVRRSGCTSFDEKTARKLAERWGIPPT